MKYRWNTDKLRMSLETENIQINADQIPIQVKYSLVWPGLYSQTHTLTHTPNKSNQNSTTLKFGEEPPFKTPHFFFLHGLLCVQRCWGPLSLFHPNPSSLYVTPLRRFMKSKRNSFESVTLKSTLGKSLWTRLVCRVSFCQSTIRVCIIWGPPLVSPRQHMPPILPWNELQGINSMQIHRLPGQLPTLTWITVNSTSTPQRESTSANPSCHVCNDDLCIIRRPHPSPTPVLSSTVDSPNPPSEKCKVQ